jgi:uncharacterized damage-inducible protein DinB
MVNLNKELMNQQHLDYATYTTWANHKLIQNLGAYDDALLQKELVGSFPTIQAPILHIWFAETGWLSRLRGSAWEASEVTNFKGSVQELFAAWQATSLDFQHFVETADLEKTIDFRHKGTSYNIPAREIVHTVFNHSSFHRGQIVMMMRQLGITDIAQTDYIEWVRLKATNKQ